MPLSMDVSLPRSHDARFSTCCVQLDLGTHGHTMRLHSQAIGLLTSLLRVYGKQFTVHIPVCQPWAARIRNCKSFAIMDNLPVVVLDKPHVRAAFR